MMEFKLYDQTNISHRYISTTKTDDQFERITEQWNAVLKWIDDIEEDKDLICQLAVKYFDACGAQILEIKGTSCDHDTYIMSDNYDPDLNPSIIIHRKNETIILYPYSLVTIIYNSKREDYTFRID